MTRLLAFLLLAGALVAYAFWVYQRAELPVRGRRLLATARSLTLLLLLALLFDPSLPASRAATAGARWAVLDVSRSMGAGDGSAWRRARVRADSLTAGGWKVVPFGYDGAESPTTPPFPEHPDGTDSRLAPVLARAVESGALEVRVLSDLRLDDPVEAAAAVAQSPLRVTLEDVGADAVNAGIAAFDVSDAPRKGERATAVLEVFAQGAGDSVTVEIREEDRTVLSREVAAPAPGRRTRVTFQLPAARTEGRVRYTAVVHAEGDAFPSDDQAAAYAAVGGTEGGLVMVSLHPDWEPRALLSVLESVTGLRATGYLRVGADRFSLMGRAVDRSAPVDSAAVRRAVEGAAILVVHGLDDHTDAWGRGLPARAARTLAWPLDASAAGGLGLRTAPAQDGEWYLSSQVPPSPLAADVAGAHTRDLPPLTGVLPLADAEAATVPLRLQLRGSGPFQPALVLRKDGARRQVVVLASGFWRWAARDGDGRDTYRRLWSGVAGWLLEDADAAGAGHARPDRWVVGPGETLRWRIPGAAGDSARLSLVAGSDTVLDTVLPTGAAVPTATVPAGSYRYRVQGPGDAVAEGRVDVSDRTLEMLPARMAPDSGAFDSGRAPSALGGGEGTRPLRTSAWPYLLILGLLCAEWMGRRRVGLR